MDKDMKCCWNCQLRTDNECQLLYSDSNKKNIIKNAEPCEFWVERRWNEEELSSSIGPFGDQKEYVNLKAKHQNSIFDFIQCYFSYRQSFYILTKDFEELEKKELYNEEFLRFIKKELPEVYKELKKQFKKRRV